MKMNSALSLFVGFIVIAALAFPGCSKTEKAVATSSSKSDTSAESGSAESGTKESGGAPTIEGLAGEWKMNAEETIKANSDFLRTPGLDVNGFKTTIRGMVMEFQLKDDNTFTCYEKANNQEANYTGFWELHDNEVGLYQETQDGREVDDELVGTVVGNRMDMLHIQQGLKINMVLVR